MCVENGKNRDTTYYFCSVAGRTVKVTTSTPSRVTIGSAVGPAVVSCFHTAPTAGQNIGNYWQLLGPEKESCFLLFYHPTNHVTYSVHY